MKKRISAVLSAIVMALCVLCACAGRDGKVSVSSHTVLGCGGYGAVFNAAIDPFNENYFGATCDMGSVYFSFDTGKTWTRHNLQGTVYCLKYDPSAEGVVWAAGSGVYKSEDHGRTMKLVFPKESELKYAGHNYENANYWMYTDKESDYAPHYQIWSMAINRKSEGKNVFAAQRVSSAGMGYNKCVRIYETKDGENFHLFTELAYTKNFKLDYDEGNDCLVVATPEKIYEIDGTGEIVCTIEQPVFVQSENGNVLSFDSSYDAAHNKNTFVFSAPVSSPHVAAACYKTNQLRNKASYVDITAELTELTTDDFGVEEVASYNSGRPSYEYCEYINGKTVPQQFAWTIANVSVLNDDVVYLFHEANTDTFDKDGTFYVNRRTIVYLKYDARKAQNERFRWVFGNPLKPYKSDISNTSWQDADSDFCFGMTSTPANEDALLYCSNVGAYYTPDGEKVIQLNSNVLSSDELTFRSADGSSQTKTLQRLSTTGVDVICTHALETDPFDKNHLIMCCTDIGILQSYDNGESWYHSLYEWQDGALKNINYAAYTNTCFEVHFDKKNKNVVYGLWSLKKTAPYAPGEGYLQGQARFGVSYDGGLSWTMTKITSDGNCQPYRMQVEYKKNKRVIYIATFSHGFFVTEDLGKSFREMNSGIEKSTVNGKTAIWGCDILVCKMGTFAVTGGAASDSSENAGHMLYKWNKKQGRFEKIGLPKEVSEANGKEYAPAAIRDIEYDAKNKCLYLACTANVVSNGAKLVKAAGGVWKYQNGEFTQIYDSSVSVCAVNLDASGRLYATELNGRVARFNRGNTACESVFDGFFHFLKRVCFGADENVLYIPTWGGGTEKIVLRREG